MSYHVTPKQPFFFNFWRKEMYLPLRIECFFYDMLVDVLEKWNEKR